MKIPTILQQHAVRFAGEITGRLWIDLLNLARKPGDEKQVIEHLARAWDEECQFLTDIERELNCRWAVDLGIGKSTDPVGLCNIYLLDEEKSTLLHEGKSFQLARSNVALLEWLERDFLGHLELLNNRFIDVFELLRMNQRAEFDQKADEFADDIMLSLSNVESTCNFLDDRFGDLETGIIVYQKPFENGKRHYGVYIYDGIGGKFTPEL